MPEDAVEVSEQELATEFEQDDAAAGGAAPVDDKVKVGKTEAGIVEETPEAKTAREASEKQAADEKAKADEAAKKAAAGEEDPAKKKAAEDAAAAEKAKSDEAAKKAREAAAATPTQEPVFAPITREDIARIETTLFAEDLKDFEVPDPDSADGKGVAKLADMKAKYPGMVETILATAAALVQRAIQPLAAQAQVTEAEKTKATILTQLASEDHGKHTDAGDIFASGEFWDWVDKQSPGIQALCNSTHPTDLAEGLTLYKAKTGKTTAAPPVDDATAKAAKEAADKIKAEQEAERKRKANLLRPTSSSSGAGAPKAKADEDASTLKSDFDEYEPD